MRDINLTLRQAYFAILKNAITVKGAAVPVYYQLVPGGYPAAYILIQNISGIGIETKTSQHRRVDIQFVICTRYTLNDGVDCDYIAGKIFELCYPDRDTVLTGCLSMDLISDTSFADFDSTKQISERFITFSHIINN